MTTITLNAPSPWETMFPIANFWAGRVGDAIRKDPTFYQFFNGTNYIEVIGTGLTYGGEDPESGGAGVYQTSGPTGTWVTPTWPPR
jgi:hypothetical protein